MTTWLLLGRGHTDRSDAGTGRSPLLPAPDGARPRRHCGFRLWALGDDTFPLLSVPSWWSFFTNPRKPVRSWTRLFNLGPQTPHLLASWGGGVD